MRPNLRFLTLLSLVGGLAVAPGAPILAEDSFTGSFSLGLRTVSVTGAEHKYREDVNLDEGPRLFGVRLSFVPDGESSVVADRVELDLTNLGGEPFETLHFSMRKYGSYRLRYDRTRSDYFYSDLILPAALASLDASSGGDFHHFDFERVRDKADLAIDLSRKAKLSIGFDRMARHGESTTTLDISRDEFELDQPLDERQLLYKAGFQYAWDRVTLVLEERVRDYENSVRVFLPGFSRGENTDDLASLDFFFLNQPYDLTSHDHTVRVLARPNDRLDLRFVGSLQDLEMDLRADRRQQGVTFQGTPFSLDESGGGGIDRDLEQYAVDISYAVSERWAVTGKVREQTLDQKGSFLFAEERRDGDWAIELSGAEVGVQFAPSKVVTLAGGWVGEEREVRSSWLLGDESRREDVTTDNTGYFASLGWRPSKAAELTVDLEANAFDNPFTLTAATDRERLRVRGRYRWQNGLAAVASHTLKTFRSDQSGWDASTEQTSLRLSRSGLKYEMAFGYSLVDLDRAIDQVVTGGSREELFAIAYGLESDFLDGRFRYAFGERVAVGGDFRLYDGRGSFALGREDLRGWVEVGVGERYVARIGYRTLDYDEDAFDFDDYAADIAEVSIGYRW